MPHPHLILNLCDSAWGETITAFNIAQDLIAHGEACVLATSNGEFVGPREDDFVRECRCAIFEMAYRERLIRNHTVYVARLSRLPTAVSLVQGIIAR